MNKIIGCGIDIEELIRFRNHVPFGQEIPAFCQMIYTEEEIRCNRGIHPHLTFPIGFSCKEACFKALGVSWTNSSISWKDIEIFFHDRNNLRDHSIRLNGYAQELFRRKKGARIESALAFTEDYVIFQVILFS